MNSTNEYTAGDIAPSLSLPQAPFFSVEYPGYVTPSSVPKAIRNLGGLPALSSAFKRSTTQTEAFLELSFRSGNPFAHSIVGNVAFTSNFLLKVVKRKYKSHRMAVEEPQSAERGDYTAEIIGVIPKVVRFRNMADYQSEPHGDDPLVELQRNLRDMDVAKLRAYRIPEEREDNFVTTESSQPIGSLRIFPPALFGRQNVSQYYNYKANPTSIIDESSAYGTKRLINRLRWKGWAPTSISFGELTPKEPPANVLQELGNANKTIMTKLRQLFDTRPIWTRNALNNQFNSSEVREITNAKYTIPLICYVFQDGPWRDTFVRLGYDPRTDMASRFWQRLYFRNVNHGVERASLLSRRSEHRTEVKEASSNNRGANTDDLPTIIGHGRSHIFDGKTLTTDIAAFQLCDIHDSMLRNMIVDEGGLREYCHERDGWYESQALDRIKAVLRHKFFNLLEGVVVTDEECEELINAGDGLPSASRNRPVIHRANKHNMAKGALPPEEATAARLRSVLGNSSSTTVGRDVG